jgi:hypothetical protein
MIERVDETERRRDDKGAEVLFWTQCMSRRVAVSGGLFLSRNVKQNTDRRKR